MKSKRQRRKLPDAPIPSAYNPTTNSAPTSSLSDVASASRENTQSDPATSFDKDLDLVDASTNQSSPFDVSQPTTYNSPYTTTSIETPKVRVVTYAAIEGNALTERAVALPPSTSLSTLVANRLVPDHLLTMSNNDVLTADRLPQTLYKADFCFIQNSGDNPTRIGFHALSSAKFPTDGDIVQAEASAILQLRKSLGRGSRYHDKVDYHIHLVPTYASRDIVDQEIAFWNKNYGAKVWFVFKIDVSKMLEKDVKIIEGRKEFPIGGTKQNFKSNDSKVDGEFLVWNVIPSDAVVRLKG